MKSDICALSGNKESLSALLDETEKAADYTKLGEKDTRRLRLLAEELVEMLPELLTFSKGEFWVENDGNRFELHVSLVPDEAMTMERREKVLAVSSSGKNAAAHGVMARIRLAAEFMMIDYGENAPVIDSAYEYGVTGSIYTQPVAWTLSTYRTNAEKDKSEPWDELERSIIANLADDVVVGVQGKRVDITVKKTF